MRTSVITFALAALVVTFPAHAEESAWTLLKKGVDAYQKGDHRKAKALFEGSVRMNPGCEDCYYYLGTIAEEAGDAASAAVLYARVTTKYPTFHLASTRLGQMAFRAGDKKKAAGHFAASAEAHPSGDTWMQLATVQLDLKEFPAAEATLRKADEFSKESPVLGEMWARLYLETKRYKDALARYDALCAKFTRDASLRFMKGACLEELGRQPEAVAEYRGVLEMDPWHEHAMRRLLSAWADDLSKTEECARMEEKLVHLKKNPPKVRPVSGKGR